MEIFFMVILFFQESVGSFYYLRRAIYCGYHLHVYP